MSRLGFIHQSIAFAAAAFQTRIRHYRQPTPLHFVAQSITDNDVAFRRSRNANHRRKGESGIGTSGTSLHVCVLRSSSDRVPRATETGPQKNYFQENW